jgi:2-polyprenyl-3-methyl-5-hydroxy-6-metoxy-1,4-benzoquinol methylase
MIQYQGLKSLETLENAKRYNEWIFQQFRPFLFQPLLEIGAGTGNISMLFPKNWKVTLSDQDKGLVTFLKQKFSKQKNTTITTIDITKQPTLSQQNYYGSILAVNVLEHIKDDTKALKNIRQLLKPEGVLGLLVPANQFAYTNVDEKLGHFRRYERKELVTKLTTSGLVIEKIYPFNFVGLLGWYFLHKLPKRSHHLSSSHVTLFELLVPVLRLTESILPIPLGISFIVIARKKTQK